MAEVAAVATTIIITDASTKERLVVVLVAVITPIRLLILITLVLLELLGIYSL
jgi:hypothetical protein